MIGMKDCPNCGSFDVYCIQDDEIMVMFHCGACGAEWGEAAPTPAPDGDDGDDDTEQLGYDGWPVDMPDDVKAWLASNR